MKHIFPTVTCAIALFAAYIVPAAAQGLSGATVRSDGGAASQSDRQAMRG